MVMREIERVTATHLTPSQMPALALCLVAVGDCEIEVYNIGDCAVILRSCLAPAFRIGSSAVEQFDKVVLGVFRDALSADASYAEAAVLAKQQILINRRSANTISGYWVVDPTDRWLDHVQYHRMECAGGEALLATDGFMRIFDVYFDVYNVANDYGDLFDHIADLGISGIIARIREIESSDPECRAFPRLKPADDASALWLRLGPNGASGFAKGAAIR
ncbi:MAG: hypothetical protein BroJett013_13780 [Alphaproteobacteria bacterium]|nr:MAG: hypothetical protein BroJett013_13780 [Alphaproteobacteria bacterium]